MGSLVTSIFLKACESWTLTAEFQKGTQAIEMKCYSKILRISYKDHVTNEEGSHEDLLTIVKRQKLQWYGHVYRSSGLAKTILQSMVKGGRRQGRQRKRWEDNIRDGQAWSSPSPSGEQGKREETCREIICGAPTTLAVKGQMIMMMMIQHCLCRPPPASSTLSMVPLRIVLETMVLAHEY